MKKAIYLAILVVGLASAGCSDNVQTGCVSDSECRYGRVCTDSVCSEPETESEGAQTEEPNTSSRGDSIDAGVFAGLVHGEEREPMVGYGGCECTPNSAFRIIAFLQHDGNASVFYEEGFLGHGFNASSESTFGDSPDTRVRFDERWRVDGEVLTVGEWLSCAYVPPAENAPEYADCVLNRDIQEADAGTNLVLRPGRELDGLPNDPEAPAYDVYTPVQGPN